MSRRQSGFTLVEIAIVLVIIGLLLGGILKGQELINSARVRNLADTASGIQAAYFGFVDRYRRVPGDWNASQATDAIGEAITGGGNDNGRLDSTTTDPWTEPHAAWEQLAAAGFIGGDYTGAAAEPDASGEETPLNAFNSVVELGRTPDYRDANAANPPARLHLLMGRGVPVEIMLELDTKLDDGRPATGVVRGTIDDGATDPVFSAASGRHWGTQEVECVDAGPPIIWNVAQDAQDCNAVFLY